MSTEPNELPPAGVADRRDDEAVIAEALTTHWLQEKQDAALAALASLSLRLQNAETALAQYGRHELDCALLRHPFLGRSGVGAECSCGFSAALASSAEREPTIFDEIAAERNRQDAKWGGNDHDDIHTFEDWTRWIAFVTEHASKGYSDNDGHADRVNFRRRMIEVAALAAAAVQSMDRVHPDVEHDDGCWIACPHPEPPKPRTPVTPTYGP